MGLLSLLCRDSFCECLKRRVDEEKRTKISRPTKKVVCWGALAWDFSCRSMKSLLCIRVTIKDANHRYWTRFSDSK